MTFEEYQDAARKTAVYPRKYSIVYPALEVSDEAGEVAGKVKKWIRDGDMDKRSLMKEIGDVLWPLANLCSDLGVTLEECAQMNIDKLKDRAERGVLGGSGDDR